MKGQLLVCEIANSVQALIVSSNRELPQRQEFVSVTRLSDALVNFSIDLCSCAVVLLLVSCPKVLPDLELQPGLQYLANIFTPFGFVPILLHSNL